MLILDDVGVVRRGWPRTEQRAIVTNFEPDGGRSQNLDATVYGPRLRSAA